MRTLKRILLLVALLGLTAKALPAQSNFSGSGGVTSGPTGPASGPTLVSSGLIGDYQMLETSGTALNDSSNSSGACTLNNAPTRVTHGVSFTAGSSQYALCPAGLNAALTIEIFGNLQSSNIGGGASQSWVIGNGNGGTSGTAGLIWTLSNAANPVTTKNSQVWSIVGGANQQCPINTWNGTGMFTWAMTGGSDTMYINGQTNVQTTLCGGTSAGAQTTGAYQLGGAAAGSGFATATYCTCTLYWARFFNRVLSAAEIAQDYKAMTAVMSGYGVNVLMTATDQTDMNIQVGDSLTIGSGMQPYGQESVLNNSLAITQRGRTGALSRDIVADFAIETAPTIRPNATRAIYTYWGGSNDLGTLTTTQIVGSIRSFCTQVHAIGGKCIATTMISRNGQDTNAAAVNPLIRQLYEQGYADGIADLAADALLAPSLNGVSACFQGDQIHYNTGCSNNNVAPVEDEAVNAIMGNNSFQTATTYASGGTAAITTTNATESSNTMTFTSAGWTAGQFVVGTRVFCTGITPAGYNGLWMVKTNGGTTFTAYNNTTGLGNQSVAGTCQGPQLQQADNYVTLNGGAVNFIMSTCLDWVGKSINFFNINAGTTTLVAINGETITGTATVAQNVHAIFMSKLTSNTSGGCTWVRTQ
jgi:hypothetical protein